MTQSRFKLVTLLVLLTLLMSLLPMGVLAQEPQKLILATTTSTADSGLLDNILPDFENEYNAKVEVVAVGTGQAIKLGEDGNADVILVHARALEDKFVADGFGVNRKDVMYNDFIILGPASDPAGIQGLTSATEAFQKIAAAQAPFVSRGDDSGTHVKEQEVWTAAGIEPQGDWYIDAGQGMGAVLTMANEQNGYTLSDRGTYLARTLEGTDLQILVEGDPVLFNPYGVIAINPEKYDTANYELAMEFINWLTSVPTQQKITDFKHPSGQSLFVPDSEEWKAAAPQKLLLATTTSTADSGLLDNILPDFEKQYNAKVEVVAVGTGQAIKLGQDGNADVILVHARAAEDKFVADGFGVNRKDVMYNDFIILGPASDPAGIQGLTSATEAFQKIAAAQAPFVSRGDDSGTHIKEKEVWAAAGIEPQGAWYIEAGQGMGAVLTMANEQNGYTLSDRGTYLARTLEGTDLQILLEGDPILFNPYGVIAINPEKYDTANYELAMEFINWLTSVPTQQKIIDFKHPSGQSLFVPDSDEWKAAQTTPPAQ